MSSRCWIAGSTFFSMNDAETPLFVTACQPASQRVQLPHAWKASHPGPGPRSTPPPSHHPRFLLRYGLRFGPNPLESECARFFYAAVDSCCGV